MNNASTSIPRYASEPERYVWAGIKARCLNPNSPNFKSYGGRGIKVCEKWMDYQGFLEDMGPRPSPLHSIERKEVDGDYCKENCKWATWDEQANNRRDSLRITIGSETLTLKQWSRKLGVNYYTAWTRLRAGYPVEKLFLKAPKKLVASVGGVTRSLGEWSRVSGVSYQTLFGRLKRGEPVLRNLTPSAP